MADNRQAKVAAGLKKLKKFQQESKKRGVKKKDLESSKTEANSNDISIHDASSINKNNNSLNEDPIQVINKPNGTSSPDNSRLIGASLISEFEQKPPTTETNPQKETSEQITIQKNQAQQVSKPREFSSTESIRQITQQVNGLMLESRAYLNGDVDSLTSSNSGLKELEQRNQELAALVEGYRQSIEHLEFQVSDLKGRINRNQREFERERTELQEKAHKELVAIKDQLQVHIQTIGILVAEKTELQSSLSQSQQTAKQKAAEVEELQGRLRASRQRVADLEKELVITSNSSQQLEKSSKDFSKEVDRLKMEVYKLTKNEEELKQQNSELLERLNKKTTDCQELEQQLAAMKSKLSLAELYNQQLSSSSDPDSSKKVEELYQEKLHLEKKIVEYEESLKKLSDGKKEMSDQYHDIVQQLSQQVTSLKDELQSVTEERNILQRLKAETEERIATLEEAQNSSIQHEEKLEDLKERLDKLDNENKELKQQLDTQTNDNAQMSQLLREQEEKLEQLEMTLAQYHENQSDKEGLLQTIQSEKVAASRAVAQNRELKKQLEELQTAFVQMSNSKLDLTEKVQHEQHISKELGERLTQQEEELQELRDLVAEKEQALRELEQSSTKLTKEMYQHHQIVDRFRHYEAQGQLTEILQQDLEQAQQRINALVNQNTDLRMALARQAESTMAAVESNTEVDAGKKTDLVASLSASVRQLEMERDQLMHQLEEQQSQRESFKAQLKGMKENINTQGDPEGVVSAEEYHKLKNVLEQLEVRFKQTMDQIADLTDQKQQLEHLVIQLQGETDTIGDYIALYQMQRGVMRKRAAEKDDYIAQLARDREELRGKLAELQALVVKLLKEKQVAREGRESQETFQQPIENDLNAGDQNANGTHANLHKDSPAPPISPDNAANKELTETSKAPQNTASKIMALLSDIGTSSLIDSSALSENFHPCPVCSGRLMTV